MAGEHAHPICARARDGVRERNDASESVSPEQIEGASDEPGFPVSRHVVQKHETPELDASISRGAECACQNRLARGDRIDRYTHKSAAAVEPISAPSCRHAPAVVVSNDERARGVVCPQALDRCDLELAGYNGLSRGAIGVTPLAPPLDDRRDHDSPGRANWGAALSSDESRDSRQSIAKRGQLAQFLCLAAQAASSGGSRRA